MKLNIRPLALAVAISSFLSGAAYAFTDVVEHGSSVTGEDINGTGPENNTQKVYGTASDTTIEAGNVQHVYAGGVANNSSALNGGEVTVDGGGILNDTTVDAASSLSVGIGGNSNNADVYGYMENIGGRDIGTVVECGAVFNVQGGEDVVTTSDDALIKQGGTVDISGQTYTHNWDISGTVRVGRTSDEDTDPFFGDATLNTGAVVLLDYNARMQGTIVNGGTLLVQSLSDDTATASIEDTTINGGDVHIGLRGEATNTQVNASTFYVDAGGTADTTTVGSGAMMALTGTASATTVYGVMANNGGTDNHTVVESGGLYTATGSLDNDELAQSSWATVGAGASAALYENTLATNWTINGVVSLQSDSAALSIANVNGGELWVTSGTAESISLSDGIMANTGGHDEGTLVSSGTYYLGGAGSGDATSSGLMVDTNGVANINSGTVTDAWISGTMYVTPHADYASTSTLQGNVSVTDGGNLVIYSGAVTSDADVTVSNAGTVFLSSAESIPGTRSSQTDYQLGAVAMNGGNVVFDDASQTGYSTLTVDSLDGTGTFYMNTDLADQQGDFLNVTGEANGDFGVYVSDSGKSPDSDASLQIIQTGGGSADFTLANTGGMVDVGTYEYRLVVNGNGNWSLTPDAQPAPPDPDDGGDTPVPPDDGGDTPTPPAPPTPEPVTPTITPSTAAVLNMAAVDPLIFQAELGSVRHRLNETRSFSHDTNVWSDVYNTRNNAATSAGAGFDQTLTGLTLGADKSKRSGRGVVTRGAFFSYSHSDVDFDRGGDGNVDSYSVGAYASYLHDNGLYLDGILKANHFENDVNGRMSSGGAANGYYDTNGVGVHLQGGKYVRSGTTYVAPYVAITGFTTDNSNYRLSNDMQAHVGNERSVLAEAGVNAGHKFTLKPGITLQPYAGAAVTQEFISDNQVNVNEDGHFTNDLSGTRGVYQVGLRAQLAKHLTAHLDAAYAQGANVESPWMANAGVSWSF